MTIAAIDRLFAPWSRPDSPGAVIAVTRHGDLIHEAAYGMADLAHGIPLDHRSLIRIGSQSKQFTVLLALMLEAEGKLSLDDEVHRHAPWLPAYPWPITLRHLATNTSGLRDFLEIAVWNGLPLAASFDSETCRDLIAGHREVNFRPGTRMLYCNTGFFLLSEIVEEISGRSFNELLAERITGPAGMPRTLLVPRDTEIHPRLASQHTQGPTGWETVRWGFPIGGEGGMASTLDDMRTWLQTLANPPAAWAPLLARMTAPVHYENGTEALYRMGLIAEHYRGASGIGHGGSVAGGRSESIRFPEHGLAITILANLAEIAPYSLARRIADIVLAADLAPVPAGPRLPAGIWREPGTGEVFSISDDGETFTTPSGSARLDPVAPGRYAPERPVHHIELEAAGEGIAATFCGEPTSYVRTSSVRPPDVSGRYANDAVDLEARVDGDTMLIRSDFGALRGTLAPMDADLYKLTIPVRPHLGTFRVTGAGLELTTDRTKGLLLRRS
jgi:CubicO group peptidase (beta-lactamase class C family)